MTCAVGHASFSWRSHSSAESVSACGQVGAAEVGASAGTDACGDACRRTPCAAGARANILPRSVPYPPLLLISG